MAHTYVEIETVIKHVKGNDCISSFEYPIFFIMIKLTSTYKVLSVFKFQARASQGSNVCGSVDLFVKKNQNAKF